MNEIKIYGSKNCPMCKTLEFWCDKITLETSYEIVTDKDQQTELTKKYDVTGYPIVIINGELTTFNDTMELFKQNRK